MNAYLLLVLLLPALAEAQTEKSADIMLELSRSINSINENIGEKSWQATASSLERMASAISGFQGFRPQKRESKIGQFLEYQEQLQRLVGESLQDLQSKNHQALIERVTRIERTCVSCHYKFRKDDNEFSPYPGRLNTLLGRVSIVKKNGRPREDRSNVIVFLDGMGNEFPPQAINPVVSQKNKEFIPRVLPIVKGTTVNLPNDDDIFHNVFSLSKAKQFDLGIYSRGTTKGVTFQNTGLVKVFCNIHPKMVANIIVLNNPYFCVTDSDGLFVILDVPDGTYALRTWHEFGPETSQTAEVNGSTVKALEIEIIEDKTFVQHHDKFGLPYREKY